MALSIKTIFNAIDKVTGPTKIMSGSVERFARQARNATSSIGSGFGRMKGLIAGAAVALTTGAMAKAVTDFAEKGDEISRTARIIGMSAESLQELRYAANMADISSEDLSTALKRMNFNLGELKRGSGTLYTQLKHTNPQLAIQLRSAKDSDEAFGLLVDAIGRETDVTRRAALAQSAFGKTGQAIIPMAEGGSAALAKLREEARKAGVVMSGDAAEAGAKLSDNLKRLKAQGTALANVVLGRLIAKVGPLIERFLAWATVNKDIIAQKVDRAFDRIGAAIEFIAPFARVALDLMKRLSPAIPYVVGGIIALTAAQWALNAAMDANPIGAIIIGLEALVVAIIVVIRYWKEITTALRTGWNKVNEIFNMPGVRIALAMIAQPLMLILSTIQTIIDLVQGKGWKSFLNMTGPWKTIADMVGLTKPGGQWNAPAAASTPLTPNAAVIQSSTTTNRSILDVNFGNTPPGTTVKQTGSAPGINLNLGPIAGGAH